MLVIIEHIVLYIEYFRNWRVHCLTYDILDWINNLNLNLNLNVNC